MPKATRFDPSDPDSWTDEQRAVQWEENYRKLSRTETDARTKLANLLRCPATWDIIITEVQRHLSV